jgi:hypothetical protein
MSWSFGVEGVKNYRKIVENLHKLPFLLISSYSLFKSWRPWQDAELHDERFENLSNDLSCSIGMWRFVDSSRL